MFDNGEASNNTKNLNANLISIGINRIHYVFELKRGGLENSHMSLTSAFVENTEHPFIRELRSSNKLPGVEEMLRSLSPEAMDEYLNEINRRRSLFNPEQADND